MAIFCTRGSVEAPSLLHRKLPILPNKTHINSEHFSFFFCGNRAKRRFSLLTVMNDTLFFLQVFLHIHWVLKFWGVLHNHDMTVRHALGAASALILTTGSYLTCP